MKRPPLFFQTYLAAKFIDKLRHALTPIQDLWTFSTRDGDVFEEVDVQKLEGSDVIFHHRTGRARLPIMELTDESRMALERGLISNAPVKSSEKDEGLRVAA